MLFIYLMGRCPPINPQWALGKTMDIMDGMKSTGAKPNEGRRILAVQGVTGNAHAYPYRADGSCHAGGRSSCIFHMSLQHRKQRYP